MFVDYFPVRLVITRRYRECVCVWAIDTEKERGRKCMEKGENESNVTTEVLKRTHYTIFMLIIPKYNNVDLLNGISKHI